MATCRSPVATEESHGQLGVSLMTQIRYHLSGHIQPALGKELAGLLGLPPNGAGISVSPVDEYRGVHDVAFPPSRQASEREVAAASDNDAEELRVPQADPVGGEAASGKACDHDSAPINDIAVAERAEDAQNSTFVLEHGADRAVANDAVRAHKIRRDNNTSILLIS